jgi:hypothetical protein
VIKRLGRTSLLTLLVAGALLVVPSIASAAVFCVGTSGGSCTTAESTLGAALLAAHSHDTIEIGPGTYDTNNDDAGAADVTVVGAGPGSTVVTGASTDNPVLNVSGTGSTVSNLEVRFASGANGQAGLVVGGTSTNVEVLAVSGDQNLRGIGLQTGQSFTGTIDLSAATGGATTGVEAAGGTITNSTIIAATGIDNNSTDLTVTASRITAATDISDGGGGIATVKNSLLENPTPCDAGCTAIYVVASNSNSGEDDEVVADQDTLVAGKTSGGVAAGSPAVVSVPIQNPDATATIDIDSSVGVGFPSASGDGNGLDCATTYGEEQLTVEYSSFDFDNQSGPEADCDETNFSHNQNQGTVGNTPVLPTFVNAAAGDFNLPFNSPLRDAGDPNLSGGTDLAGNPRVVGPRSDIGAFEYQDGAPTGRISAAGSATTSQSVSFSGSGSTDPNDGESISSYAWSFDDGATATGSTVAHAFTTVGTHTATLTVTEPNGLTAKTTATVTVALPAPVITGLSFSHRRFRRANKAAHAAKAAKAGTTINFHLSEAASVTLTFVRVRSGREKDGGCVPPTHKRRHLPACTRDTPAGSPLSFSLPAGTDTIDFYGKGLAPGSYELTVAAQATSGPPASPVQATFTVLR